MVNKKQYATVFGFILLTVIVITLAVSQQIKKDSVSGPLDVESALKTQFEKVHFYSLEKEKEKLFLRASSLDIEDQNIVAFNDPNGRYFISNEWVKFEADSGVYNSVSTELKLNDGVKFTKKDADFSSEDLYLNHDKQFLEARGDVQAKFVEKENKEVINLSSNYLSSWLNEQRSLFLGNVQGLIKRDRRYEGEVRLKSGRLEYDQSKLLISLENDVNIDRNTYHLEAQKGNIYLENFNKKLKYYSLSDDIRLVEKFRLRDGSQRVRRAFAERLEGFISEGRIVLLGTPRVEQGNDVIKGYQITLRENVDVVEVDDSQSSFDIKREK